MGGGNSKIWDGVCKELILLSLRGLDGCTLFLFLVEGYWNTRIIQEGGIGNGEENQNRKYS